MTAQPVGRATHHAGVSLPVAWRPDRRVVAAAAFVIAVVLLSHLPNMLNYPYVEDDEGYYFSQAWSVFHEGALGPSPYPYYYEHAPLGWIQIGLWLVLNGGASFGYAVASGRVLMLLFQVASSLLVFSVGRKASGRVWVGVLAALIFALSPFGIYYHRRLLLDNVTTFWILVSVWALVGPVTLRRVWLSAVALAIAILSKEIAIALVPAMFVLAVRQTPRASRPFAIAGWLGITIAVVSGYALLALLKGEFFAAGTALGGVHPHVSLLCSLDWQMGRGPHDGGILNPSSEFWTQTGRWIEREPLLVVGGSAAAAMSVRVFRGDRVISMLGWMVLSLWLFIARGGILIDFYLVPFLPLLALVLALVVHRAAQAVTRLRFDRARLLASVVGGLLCLACTAAVAVAYDRAGQDLWRSRTVHAQTEAVSWTREHLPANSRMFIDMFMWFDLHHPGPHGPRFRYAEYYFKVADPAITRRVFSNDWRRVQYVITTRQLLTDVRNSGFTLIANALNHSTSVARFETGDWPVEVRKVDPRLPNNRMLRVSVNHDLPPACMRYGS